MIMIKMSSMHPESLDANRTVGSEPVEVRVREEPDDDEEEDEGDEEEDEDDGSSDGYSE